MTSDRTSYNHLDLQVDHLVDTRTRPDAKSVKDA
jgi:hypothetical protein